MSQNIFEADETAKYTKYANGKTGDLHSII